MDGVGRGAQRRAEPRGWELGHVLGCCPLKRLWKAKGQSQQLCKEGGWSPISHLLFVTPLVLRPGRQWQEGLELRGEEGTLVGAEKASWNSCFSLGFVDHEFNPKPSGGHVLSFFSYLFCLFSLVRVLVCCIVCVLVKVKKVNPCITSVCLNTATVWLCAMNLQSRKSDLCNDFFSWNKNLKASMARGGCKTPSLDFLHSSL